MNAGPFLAEIDESEEQSAECDDDEQIGPGDAAHGFGRVWWRSPRHVAGSCDSWGGEVLAGGQVGSHRLTQMKRIVAGERCRKQKAERRQ